MSPRDPKHPEASEERALVTTSGVEITVREPEPPPPEPEEPEVERGPRARVRPPDRPHAERDVFVAQVAKRWEQFIARELRRRGVPPESTRDLGLNVLEIAGKHFETNGNRGPDDVRGFLSETADNQARNYKRLRRLKIELGADLDQEIASSLDPERAVMLAEMEAMLAGYRAGLTAEEREVYDLRELDELTWEAIAKKVGRPVMTVKNQHTRADGKVQELARESERRTVCGGRR